MTLLELLGEPVDDSKRGPKKRCRRRWLELQTAVHRNEDHTPVHYLHQKSGPCEGHPWDNIQGRVVTLNHDKANSQHGDQTVVAGTRDASPRRTRSGHAAALHRGKCRGWLAVRGRRRTVFGEGKMRLAAALMTRSCTSTCTLVPAPRSSPLSSARTNGMWFSTRSTLPLVETKAAVSSVREVNF